MARLTLKVQSNTAQLAAEARQIAREFDARARARALNRTMERSRTFTSRAVREEYRITNKVVLDRVDIGYASADRPVGALNVKDRPMSLASFQARQTKAGVVVNVKGARKLIRGAFIRTLRTKKGDEYEVVFHRGKRPGAPKSGRLPIQALKTVDVVGLFVRGKFQEALNAFALEQFDREYGRQLELAIQRGTRGG